MNLLPLIRLDLWQLSDFCFYGLEPFFKLKEPERQGFAKYA